MRENHQQWKFSRNALQKENLGTLSVSYLLFLKVSFLLFSRIFLPFFNTILIVRISYFSVLSQAIFKEYLLAKIEKKKVLFQLLLNLQNNRIDLKVNRFTILVFLSYILVCLLHVLILLFPVLFSFFFSVQIVLTRKVSCHQAKNRRGL